MSAPPTEPAGPYGLVARFAQPAQMVRAAEAARDAGYRKMNCYSPYPIPGAWEALGHQSKVPLVTLLGGLGGCVLGFGFITWTQVVDYPWNIGGRPPFSWPAFIPPTFETTILFAGLTAALVGAIALNGLPRLYHPVFNFPSFDRASQDRYFLVIEADDPRFELARTAEFLRGLGAEEVGPVDL
ncbi:MAG TPA: DUF3341 domain-containing protein [Thermoanaerobaculia bacterium]|nr:DUF3341 domain-containing protein [Thermoanaerobaculia bacterium]